MASELSNIIQQGEEVKYKITITHPNFIMNEDNFRVKLPWGMLNKQMVITKSQMISNENDDWYFMFPTDDMIGRVKAECSFDVPDSDYADGFRTEVDRQYLCFVTTDPMPCICLPLKKSKDNTVVYERTENSDVAELYSIMTDKFGRQLTTSDGETLAVLKELMN